MDKLIGDTRADPVRPRRIHSDSTGTYVVCARRGMETKLGPLAVAVDETTNEEVVGIRDHMPRAGAD